MLVDVSRWCRNLLNGLQQILESGQNMVEQKQEKALDEGEEEDDQEEEGEGCDLNMEDKDEDEEEEEEEAREELVWAAPVTKDNGVLKKVQEEGHGEVAPQFARCLGGCRHDDACLRVGQAVSLRSLLLPPTLLDSVHYTGRLADGSCDVFWDTRAESSTGGPVTIVAGRGEEELAHESCAHAAIIRLTCHHPSRDGLNRFAAPGGRPQLGADDHEGRREGHGVHRGSEVRGGVGGGLASAYRVRMSVVRRQLPLRQARC